MPQPHAGGSFATTAWQSMKAPAALEEIEADAGLDIGGTLIGMHLKRVAVPVRLSVRRLGQANLSSTHAPEIHWRGAPLPAGGGIALTELEKRLAQQVDAVRRKIAGAMRAAGRPDGSVLPVRRQQNTKCADGARLGRVRH